MTDALLLSLAISLLINALSWRIQFMMYKRYADELMELNKEFSEEVYNFTMRVLRK